MKDLSDLMREEEDAALAAHRAWLADPEAQKAHAAQVERNRAKAARELANALTPAQRLAELRARLDELINTDTPGDDSPEAADVEEEIDQVRAEIAELERGEGH
jgi:hypothetical protein